MNDNHQETQLDFEVAQRRLTDFCETEALSPPSLMDDEGHSLSDDFLHLCASTGLSIDGVFGLPAPMIR